MVKPGNDNLQNRWGVNLIEEPSRFGAELLPKSFSTAVTQLIPGYDVLRLCPNGTSANHDAMIHACGIQNGLGRCMIGMGSYCGGEWSGLHKYSSSVYSHSMDISLVAAPSSIELPETREQTIALPYTVKEGRLLPDDRVQSALEDACLRALNKKLVVAWAKGKPYKALLLEILLSGCGGRLRDIFLIKLASLATHFRLRVIVDECLTGGRVGPRDIVLTKTTPPEFQKCVAYITMGKFLNCGLILIRNDINRWEEAENMSPRGYSTNIDSAEALYKLRQVHSLLQDNASTERRKFILKKLKIPEDEAWGEGLIIFIPKSYRQGTQNLKNRLLPMMTLKKKGMDSIKLSPSVWDSSKISQHLHEICTYWLQHMESQNNALDMLLPSVVEFVMCEVKKTVDADLTSIIQNPSHKATEEIRITADAIIRWMGGEEALQDTQNKLQEETMKKGKNLRMCRKTIKMFVEDAMKELCGNKCEENNFVRFMSRKRRGSDRRLAYSVYINEFPKFGLC